MNKRNSKRLVFLLTLLVFCMFAFAFALVPIYNSLCKALSINGKISLKATPMAANTQPSAREVIVEFVATNNGSVPWLFYPKIKRVKIHPGEMARLAFYAENQTNRRMTVQAIPSVTPGHAAKYIKKTECFCFVQQTLEGHEGMNMPLMFHLDKDLPKDITTLTLAYTLFDVTDRVKQQGD